MYPIYADGLVAGREEFPVAWVLAENTFYLAIWALGAFLLWPVWRLHDVSLLGWTWILLVVVIQILLKKHNCTGCVYYDKRCHLGWGKLAARLFDRDSGNPATGQRLALFYVLSPPLILLTSLVHGLLNGAGGMYWVALALFVFLNAVTFPVRRSGCSRCKMRKVCPGSAARG